MSTAPARADDEVHTSNHHTVVNNHTVSHHLNNLFKITRAVHGDGDERERRATYELIMDIFQNRNAMGISAPTLSNFLQQEADVTNFYARRRHAPKFMARLAKLFIWARDALPLAVPHSIDIAVPPGATRMRITFSTQAES